MKRAYPLLLFVVASASACAQKPAASAPADADIPRIVKEIRADRIEKTIRTLVSFGTRNTLSTQDDPKRGIGAARDWLYQQFQDVAKTSDGRMTVELQTFEQAAGRFPRIAAPTKVTNVVATWRGTQTESAE